LQKIEKKVENVLEGFVTESKKWRLEIVGCQKKCVGGSKSSFMDCLQQ
jgi:hypothetical protein